MASPVVGPPLTHSEVKAQVEAASPALLLEVDQGLPGSSGPGKGRILVARRSIGVGEVLLAEWPIFQGTPSASQSRKAFEAGFVALADNFEDFTDLDEDCLHPCSALCDCVAGIMLAKQQALAQGVRSDSGGCGGVEAEERRERSRLRLLQLGALCRSATESPPSDCAQSLLGVLRPGLRELTSEDELNDFLHVLSSNRFGSAGSQLDVMFAGSMFEHSCDPSCFVAGAWSAIAAEGPREYRALRDIAVGEALSVDYMMLPGSYLGFSGRKETLTGWGFACSCPRCTERPELTRAFVCPACELHELCPTRPVPSGEAVELLCRACGKLAEADYSASCLSAETVVAQVFGGGARTRWRRHGRSSSDWRSAWGASTSPTSIWLGRVGCRVQTSRRKTQQRSLKTTPLPQTVSSSASCGGLAASCTRSCCRFTTPGHSWPTETWTGSAASWISNERFSRNTSPKSPTGRTQKSCIWCSASGLQELPRRRARRRAIRSEQQVLGP